MAFVIERIWRRHVFYKEREIQILEEINKSIFSANIWAEAASLSQQEALRLLRKLSGEPDAETAFDAISRMNDDQKSE